MDKYEYLWMKVRNNHLPGDLTQFVERCDDFAEDSCELQKKKNIGQYSYEELMNMKAKQLAQSTILSPKQVEYIMSTKTKFDIDKEYEIFLNSGVNAVCVGDSGYPERLRNIENRPYALFYYGELPENEIPSVAIIGARKCTEYGHIMANDIASGLSKKNINIISGMAYGIDGIAQEAALDARDFRENKEVSSSSYGVLGSGVDVCYPRANKALYDRLKSHGGIISEYPVNSPAMSENFPFRNRIISALSDIVIVIEARLRSGTFITVDCALSQGKEIMVVPGRVSDPLSVGCNALISQGAFVVQSAEDVLRLFETMPKESFFTKTTTPSFKTSELKKLVPKPSEKILLEREENMVYSVLDFYSQNPEEISGKANMDIFEVMSILISLEMKGIIKETGKNLYVKCR